MRCGFLKDAKDSLRFNATYVKAKDLLPDLVEKKVSSKSLKAVVVG